MYKLSNIFKTDNIEQKRKILSNFPITREDRNKTLNELANANSGGSGGNISKYAPRYYKLAEDTPKEFVETIAYSSTIKVIADGNIGIYPTVAINGFTIEIIKYIGFSFIPIYGKLVDTKQFVYSFDELLNILANGDEEKLNSIKQYITETTEEEFYKID